MKPGTKLKSTVCDTEVMVIKASREVALSCGGAPMVAERRGVLGTIDSAFAGGSLMGKRYTDAAQTLEVLCVKSGKGSLAADGVVLVIKDAKPLPSSD
jgi:hypothetical protein